MASTLPVSPSRIVGRGASGDLAALTSDQIWAILGLNATTITINGNGAAADFIIQGDTKPNLFHVDGVNDRVGVGLVPTDGLLHISSGSAGVVTASTSADELVLESSDGFAGMSILNTDAGFGSIAFNNPADTGGALVYVHTSRALGFFTGGRIVADNFFTALAGTIFNEDGRADQDFRVESDSNINMIFVDASTNAVGIGKIPAAGVALDVNGLLRLEANGTEGGEIIFAPGSAETAQEKHIDSAGNLFRFHTAGTVVFSVSILGDGVFHRGLVVNAVGDAAGDLRVGSDLNTHMFFVDAGNNSVHIDNSLLTGAGDGDLVMANNKSLRFIDNAGTTSANYGIGSDTSDNLNISVPATTDNIRFFFGGSQRVRFKEENGGVGLVVVGESSADHSAPAANAMTIYTKDVGGETQLYCRNSSIVRLLSPTLGTAIITTSGTAHDFTGLPAALTQITIIFSGVSLSGTDSILVQIGDGGGFEFTGYSSTSVATNGVGTGGGLAATNGYVVVSGAAGVAISGTMTLTRMNASHLWVGSHAGRSLGSISVVGGGNKTLSAELTQVRVTRTGTDTFDAGSINIYFQ